MWDIELAKMFKERDNKSSIGAITGYIVSPLPSLKISIFDGSILLENEDLYICGKVDNIEFESIEIIGTEVLLIPTSSEQRFYVIDKVRKLGWLYVPNNTSKYRWNS